MPSYDYKCHNDECGNESIVHKFCSISDSYVFPICPECENSMTKVFVEMPSVSWKYINPSGQVRTSSMGPAERDNNRHAGWQNGTKVLQPVYKSKRKELKDGK